MAQSLCNTSTPLHDAIRSVYNKLLSHLCTKHIREELYARGIIEMPLKQTIQSKDNDKEANEALVDHLITSGTIKLVKKFIQILRDTSSSYKIHEEIAQSLEGALRVHNVPTQSLPGQSESLLILFGKLVRERNVQLKVVPPEMTIEELQFVELAVVKSSEHLKRKKDITNFIDAAVEGIDKFYEKSESIKYECLLTSYEHYLSEMQKSSIIYQQISGAPGCGKRIVISGAPGCGKTTLSRKYCKDLSSGTLQNDYQLILLCHLRDVSHCLKENEELTLKHFFAKYSSRYDVSSIITELLKTGGKGVLLILDGYDEMSDQMKKSSVLKSILSPSSLYLDQCDVIVTTRPFTCPEVLAGMEHKCLHVEILGFTEENINLFIDNYFRRTRFPNKKMADQLKEKLQNLPSVQGMCRLPVVLKIICKVQEYLEDEGLPHTMGGIYHLYIKRQLLLNPDINQEDLSIADILSVPEDAFPGFSSLCQVSYNFCVKQNLVLSKRDLGEELLNNVKRGSIYGLLFAESADDIDAASPVQLYMFLHKTVQEALAAVHVAKQTKPEQERIWREQLGRPEMAEVWKFYCNFTKLQNVNVLSLVQANTDQSFKRNLLLMLSFFEADNENLSKHYLPQVISNELTFRISSGYESLVLQYTLQHHGNICMLQITSNETVKTHFHLVLPAILSQQHLEELDLDMVALDKDYNVTLPEKCLVSCQRLKLQDVKFSSKQLVTLLRGIGKDKEMKEIKLVKCFKEGHSDSIEDVIKSLHVERLSISEETCASSDYLGSVVSKVLQNRWIIDLKISIYSGECLALTLPEECLVSCQRCLLEMMLTPNQWMVLVTNIAKSKILKQLIVDIHHEKTDGPVDQGLCESVISSLKNMPSLKRFGMLVSNGEYPLTRSLLLGALYNTSTTDVYIYNNIEDYGNYEYLENLWKGQTDVVPVSSSLKCRLELTFPLHDWVDLFIGIAQAERLEEIKVTAVISEKTDGPVDQRLCESVISSLKNMPSLKRFGVLVSNGEYPLIRSLLLGALYNTSTTDVCISHSDENCDDYAYLGKLWKGQTDVVPISSSLKCRLKLSFPLHEWADLFIGIAQAERLEEIKVTAEIIKKTDEPVNQGLCESVIASLKNIPSLKRFGVLVQSPREYPLIRSLLLGALYNTSTTDVDICSNDYDYEYFDKLWKGQTDVVPVSSSLKCRLELTFPLHDWVDLFIGIAQAERLEEIKVTAEISEITNEPVNQGLCESVIESLKNMPSLKRFGVLVQNPRVYPLIPSLLLGTLYNTSATDVYICNNDGDYDEYGYLENLWKGQTDVVPVSSSLKCRLELTFPLHEWVDLFIGIAQAERLEEIKVTAEIIKETDEPVNQGLCESVISSLKNMPSLKRFSMLVWNRRVYPLIRSLLLGALYNTSTTDVNINNDDSYCDYANEYEHLDKLCKGQTDVVPISSSLKCRLRLNFPLHEWVDLFIDIAQAERLEEIKVIAEISESSADVEALPKLREVFSQCNWKVVEIFHTKPFTHHLLEDQHLYTSWMELMLSILEGVAANLHKIAFAMKFDNNLLRQCPTIVCDLESKVSFSSKEMFEWSNDGCVLKTLETRQSLRGGVPVTGGSGPVTGGGVPVTGGGGPVTGGGGPVTGGGGPVTGGGGPVTGGGGPVTGGGGPVTEGGDEQPSKRMRTCNSSYDYINILLSFNPRLLSPQDQLALHHFQNQLNQLTASHPHSLANCESQALSIASQSHLLPGDRVSHLLPGDRVSHLLPGDRVSHLLPGDRVSHLLPDDRVSHSAGDRVSHLLPDDRVSHLLPDDRVSHLLPGDRVSHLLPDDRVSHLLPGDRVSHLLPGDRVSHLLPGDRVSHSTNPFSQPARSLTPQSPPSRPLGSFQCAVIRPHSGVRQGGPSVPPRHQTRAPPLHSSTSGYYTPPIPSSQQPPMYRLSPVVPPSASTPSPGPSTTLTQACSISHTPFQGHTPLLVNSSLPAPTLLPSSLPIPSSQQPPMYRHSHRSEVFLVGPPSARPHPGMQYQPHPSPRPHPSLSPLLPPSPHSSLRPHPSSSPHPQQMSDEVTQSHAQSQHDNSTDVE